MQKLQEKPIEVTSTDPLSTDNKHELESFIRSSFPTNEGEVLRICWLKGWDNHYRLNFWKINEEKVIKDNYIDRSIFVVIKSKDGQYCVEKEYTD